MCLTNLQFVLFFSLVVLTTAFEQRSQYLNKKQTVLLQWTTGRDAVVFDISAPATGWIGLGFSPNGGMAGADIVVVWQDANGSPKISDRHAQRNGFPEEDQSQNYELLSLTRNSSHIRAKFRRAINTCDPEDTVLTNGTIKVIYAFNNEVPYSKNYFAKHSAFNRGTKSLFLFDKPSQLDDLPADTKVREYRAKNVAVPSDRATLYWCSAYQFDSQEKEHLIKFEPIIQEGNEPFVHHMILYKCQNEYMKYYVGHAEPCFSDDGLASDLFGCVIESVAVWGVGGEGISYPRDIAKPITSPSGKPIYFMLEIHYDNANYVKGIVDSSGLRIYTTKHYRNVEIGQLLIGTPPYEKLKQIIPPGQKSYWTFIYCTADCTKEMRTPVTIFSVLQHSHLAGRKMVLSIIRNGVEIPIINDQTYDWDYQEQRVIPDPIQIIPGDVIIGECGYSTDGRDTTTFGNEGTHDEMCQHFIDYFPQPNDRALISCQSYPDIDQQLAPVGLRSNAYNQQSTINTLKNKQWSQYEISSFQQAAKNSTHNGDCLWATTDLAAINQAIQYGQVGQEEAKAMRENMINGNYFKQHGYPKIDVPFRSRVDQKCTLG